MPDGKGEYEFLLEGPVVLTESENEILIDKLCTPIRVGIPSDQLFPHEEFTAGILKPPPIWPQKIFPLDILPEEEGATLCKNSIEEFFDENGCSYLCESLIEFDGKYMLVVSELYLNEGKVSSAKKRSSFNVTSAEAAMMLNHPEFITVY